MPRTKHRLIVAISLISLSMMGLLTSVFLYQKNTPNKTVNNSYQIETKLHYAYPNDKEFFDTTYKFATKKNIDNNNIIGGIIPHHLLAADLIADFFYNLEGADFDTVILLGPNHFSAGDADIITSIYDWQTPYGTLPTDKKLLSALTKKINLKIEPTVLDGEHAVTSEVSFIKKTFPKAKFLPIILKAGVKADTANNLAQAILSAGENKKILVLASVDFSHYKTSQEAQADDKISIQALENSNLDTVYNLALDSPATIYTLLKYSQLRQGQFELLANSNSALLADQPDIDSTTSYVTGYFLPRQKNIKLMFVGDIMLSRYVGDIMARQDNWSWPFEPIANFTSQADILFGNLEGPISDEGRDMGATYSFRADPKSIAGLQLAGFDILSLANNHIADWGRDAIRGTLENLTKNNIAYTGAGFDNNESHKAKIIEKNNTKFGFLAYTPFANQYSQAGDNQPGITNFSQKQIALDIQQANEVADVVIVSFHFGDEYQTIANSYQTNLAHMAIDNGADLVIGHHPHVVQNIEQYQDAYIVYSLGNFIFDQTFSEETMSGLIFEADFQGSSIIATNSIPTQISYDSQVSLAN